MYAIEEEKEWTVVFKDFEGRVFYKPCAVDDLKWANEDGWNLIKI